MALVAATLVLVAGGLLASGLAVTTILRHDLTNRVDQTLLDASVAGRRLRAGCRRRRSKDPNPARPPVENFYVRGIDPDGRIWMAVNDRAAEPGSASGQRCGTRCRCRRVDRPLVRSVARDECARIAR